MSPSEQITVPVPPGLADLADARGVPVEELVAEALRRFVAVEAAPVRHEAQRLAQRHEALLRRLGA
ncbi:hypothetical protein ABZV60_13475 [Streptomyces sp. NPDC004787]|uniref:hypothetical protein n=1 Tax=Streptomyces sp. NPDC004787 TaxID=3154291 RepID=UPI00339EACC3